MRISLSADELSGIAGGLAGELERRGHETLRYGVLADGERGDWAWASAAAALDVAEGRAEQGIVCCWTGTGASIAANKIADQDAAVARALAAGAREIRAVADEHGWRMGRIEDPFGHRWEIGRPPVPWPPEPGERVDAQ